MLTNTQTTPTDYNPATKLVKYHQTSFQLNIQTKLHQLHLMVMAPPYTTLYSFVSSN